MSNNILTALAIFFAALILQGCEDEKLVYFHFLPAANSPEMTCRLLCDEQGGKECLMTIGGVGSEEYDYNPQNDRLSFLDDCDDIHRAGVEPYYIRWCICTK